MRCPSRLTISWYAGRLYISCLLGFLPKSSGMAFEHQSKNKEDVRNKSEPYLIFT